MSFGVWEKKYVLLGTKCLSKVKYPPTPKNNNNNKYIYIKEAFIRLTWIRNIKGMKSLIFE